MNRVSAMARKVADTPLAHAINDLIGRYGSDEKFAAEVGCGATRFSVISWRKGRNPEKQEYVDRLIELGIDPDLLVSRSDRRVQQESEMLKNQQSALVLLEGLRAGLEDVVEAVKQAQATAAANGSEIVALRGELVELRNKLEPPRTERVSRRRA